jgi:hypothetical protein
MTGAVHDALSIAAAFLLQPFVVVVLGIAAALYVIPAILRRMKKGWN